MRTVLPALARQGPPAILALGVLLASPAGAQDVRSMDTWMAAKAVHYHVAVEYTGDPLGIFSPDPGLVGGRMVTATDRLEVDFDWSDQEMKVLGKLSFKNFPTKASVVEVPGCPATRVDGPFELATVQSVKATEMMGVDVEVRRDIPGGSIPYAGEGPCNAWSKVTPRQQTFTMTISIMPGIGMVLAQSPPGKGNITADGKSIRGDLRVKVPDSTTETWTIFYTPTPAPAP